MEAYKEQFKRTHRYYIRFKNLNNGIKCRASSEAYIDDMHAFFQNCYHLKDWLKNDLNYTLHTNKQIEDFVSNSFPLSICADICNGTKHLSLSKEPRSKSVPKFARRTISMDFGAMIDSPNKAQCATLKIKFQIEHNGKNIDALELATEAMKAWEVFTKFNITSH